MTLNTRYWNGYSLLTFLTSNMCCQLVSVLFLFFFLLGSVFRVCAKSALCDVTTDTNLSSVRQTTDSLICCFLEIYRFLFSICLLCQTQGLPLVAEVTWEGSLITVAEPDVDFQGCQRCAGHVTEGTLDLIYWKMTAHKKYDSSNHGGRLIRTFGTRAIRCVKCLWEPFFLLRMHTNPTTVGQ